LRGPQNLKNDFKKIEKNIFKPKRTQNDQKWSIFRKNMFSDEFWEVPDLRNHLLDLCMTGLWFMATDPWYPIFYKKSSPEKNILYHFGLEYQILSSTLCMPLDVMLRIIKLSYVTEVLWKTFNMLISCLDSEIIIYLFNVRINHFHKFFSVEAAELAKSTFFQVSGMKERKKERKRKIVLYLEKLYILSIQTP